MPRRVRPLPSLFLPFGNGRSPPEGEVAGLKYGWVAVGPSLPFRISAARPEMRRRDATPKIEEALAMVGLERFAEAGLRAALAQGPPERGHQIGDELIDVYVLLNSHLD